jgi:excinuclease ABC subunit B
LDLPEVSLVAITDADKEGFLRSERSLIQTIGRAARNAEGKVILYADRETESMKKAMGETSRRRAIQEQYNIDHGITPSTIKKRVSEGLINVYNSKDGIIVRDKPLEILAAEKKASIKDPNQIEFEIAKLRRDMKKASDGLDFEEAARLRDEIKRLQMIEMKVMSDGPAGQEAAE